MTSTGQRSAHERAMGSGDWVENPAPSLTKVTSGIHFTPSGFTASLVQRAAVDSLQSIMDTLPIEARSLLGMIPKRNTRLVAQWEQDIGPFSVYRDSFDNPVLMFFDSVGNLRMLTKGAEGDFSGSFVPAREEASIKELEGGPILQLILDEEPLKARQVPWSSVEFAEDNGSIRNIELERSARFFPVRLRDSSILGLHLSGSESNTDCYSVLLAGPPETKWISDIQGASTSAGTAAMLDQGNFFLGEWKDLQTGQGPISVTEGAITVEGLSFGWAAVTRSVLAFWAEGYLHLLFALKNALLAVGELFSSSNRAFVVASRVTAVPELIQGTYHSLWSAEPVARLKARSFDGREAQHVVLPDGSSGLYFANQLTPWAEVQPGIYYTGGVDFLVKGDLPEWSEEFRPIFQELWSRS
ncbi:MAG: hypothetical protein KC561_07945 [Myxococcales bacterium]|nr:hypothetical protein [Myxococcales bacterium]